MDSHIERVKQLLRNRGDRTELVQKDADTWTSKISRVIRVPKIDPVQKEKMIQLTWSEGKKICLFIVAKSTPMSVEERTAYGNLTVMTVSQLFLDLEGIMFPACRRLEPEEKGALLKRYRDADLPKISNRDVAVLYTGAREGDILMFERDCEEPYYRLVTKMIEK
jgi:DNA-directed RNA polymerase subunit H (RpoH/RPB5)